MKIAAYCRVSTDHDDQLNSLENQKSFFTDYAKQNRHELYRVYADEGISGTSLKKRTEFKRLMEDAKYGLFEMVVVKDVSRFARNTVDFLQSIRTLKAMGINTIFLTANMTSLGDSEFVLTIFGAMAQEESANLSKRVKWGKKITAQQGRVPPRVYGYDRINNLEMKINEKEASVVREIFRLYLEEGMGCRLISIRLNEMGASTKMGADWNPRGVRRVLQNSIYCGHYVNRKYEIGDYLEGKLVRLPEAEHIHHERPEWAIISKDIFDQAQLQLEARRQQYNTPEPMERRGRYSNCHVFSNLIRCPICGRSFSRRTHVYKNTYHYWRCPTNQQLTAKTCPNKSYIQEEVLLEAIRGYLNSIIGDRDRFVSEAIAEFQKAKTSFPEPVLSRGDIESRIKKLEAKKSKYQEMYAEDLITITELKKKLDPIRSEIDTLTQSLTGCQIADKKAKNVKSILEEYVNEIDRFLKLETVTNMDMRKVIDKITIDSDRKVTIFIKKIDDLQGDYLPT